MAKKNQRKNDNNISLISVIGKVKNISDREYDGRVYDHILSIFNKLTTKEKRVLLRGLINIVFIVEDKVLLNSTDLDKLRENVSDVGVVNDKIEKEVNDIRSDVKDIKTIDEEQYKVVKKDIEKTNKLFVKVTIIMVITSILLVITLLTEFSPEIYNSISNGVLKLIKFLVLL